MTDGRSPAPLGLPIGDYVTVYLLTTAGAADRGGAGQGHRPAAIAGRLTDVYTEENNVPVLLVIEEEDTRRLIPWHAVADVAYRLTPAHPAL